MSSISSLISDEAFGRVMSLHMTDAQMQQAKAASGLDGLGTAITNIFEHTYDVGAMMALKAVEEPAMAIAEDIGTDQTVRQWFDQKTMERREELKASRPDPRTMSVTSQGVQQIGQVLLPALAGALTPIPGGAALAVGATTGTDKYWELRDQGVNHETASKGAAITGTTMGVGAFLPAYLGTKLATQLTSAIGLNAGLGMAERGGISTVLKDAGYDKTAEQYKVLDAEALTVDAILGAAFVGIGRFAGRRNKVPDEAVDDAQTANLQLHQELNAPGLVTKDTDLEIQTRNRIAMEEAIFDGKKPNEVILERTESPLEPNPILARESLETIRAMDENVQSATGRTLADTVREMDLANQARQEVDNAIQERSAAEVDVREQARDGEAVAGRDTQEEVAATRTPEEEAKLRETAVQDEQGNVISALQASDKIASDMRKYNDFIKCLGG